VPLKAVVICGEIVLLRAARIIFLIVIGFPEVVWQSLAVQGLEETPIGSQKALM